MPLVESQPDALARTYAASVFELAMQAGQQAQAESVLSELEGVLEIARTDARFAEFLSSQILGAKARGASIAKIFKGRVSDLTLNFLLVLNHKGRLGHLPAIVGALDEMAQQAFGRVEVDVYTAAPISTEELASVRAGLQKVLGKEPVVHPYIDENMIGGLKIQIGDQLIDASIATRLRNLRDRLTREGASKVRSAADRMLD